METPPKRTLTTSYLSSILFNWGREVLSYWGPMLSALCALRLTPSALCALRHVYPARPVEPGTLRVFNWGAMRSLLHWGPLRHALCPLLPAS